MATRPDSTSNRKIVYVKTNLNTRLLVRASLSDTVSHIKDMLLLEHMKANPEIGEIKIDALKVKRRGELYTMPDSLPVSDILPGNKRSCYLSADCSKISISYEPSLSEGLKTDGTDDRLLLSSPDIASRKNVVSGISNGVKDGTSSKAGEGKKRKIRHKENVRDNTGLEGMDTKDAILTEMADSGNVMVEATESVNLESVVPDNSVSGKKSQNDGNNMEGVSIDESNQDAGSIDNSGTLLNVKSDSKRRKKSKKAAKVQNLSDLEPETKKGESIQEPYMAGESDALESDKRKDDNVMENAMADTIVAGKSENGLSQISQANHPESPSTKELSLSEINHGDPIQNANAHGLKKRKKKKKDETDEKTLVPATEKIVGNSQNLLASDDLNDNTMLDSGIPTEKSEVIVAKDSNLSARAVDTSDTMQEVKSEGKKRKKSKKKGVVQDMPHLEHEIGQGESSEPFVKAVNTVEMGDEGRLSLNDNMMLLSQSKNPDCVEKELTKEPISSLPDPSEANIVPDQKISDGTGKRKKKRDKKPADINLEKSVLEQTDNGMNVSSVLLNFGIAEEIKKHPNANENESNNAVFRADQPLGDDGTKKNIVNENQSLDRHNANIAVLAKENDIMESNRAETNSGEAKKSKKKTRKSRVSTSDVQENFPVQDQKISAEISPITEGCISIKGANITSEANEKLSAGNENEANIVISQVLQTLEYDGTTKENDSDFPVLENENKILESNQADKISKDKGVKGKKSEKKRKKSQVSDVQENSSTNVTNITSSRANERLPTGNENESNFVISQTEQTLDDDVIKKKNMVNDADCPVLVKEKEILESNMADKSIKGKSDEDKISKKERKKSQVTASDVQENFPIKDKTISAETKENLAIKGAHVVSSQVIPDKSEEHLKMVNDDHEIDFKLHFVHEKKQHKVASGDNVQVKKRDLVQDANTKMAMKTPLEKSTFIKPMDLFQDHSKNSITNKMMMTMKTPEKQNLFTKSGSIFQDNSVEDDMDDNGRTVTSDASTHESSDSSSDSGDSEGESGMSHNESGDGKMISDSGMLEMRKILRSSEQFKKAKLIASQTEPEMDELLLNSQPE